jgi:hypothetical protein
MSDNPFGDLPTENPYVPPTGRPVPMNATNPLMIPAIALLVMASLTLLLLIASLPGQIIRLRKIDTSTPAGQGELVAGIVVFCGWVLATVAVMAGSINMWRLNNHRAATAAAIVSVLPVCSPCFILGIPFGIWALVLLYQPKVKALFR